MATKYYAVLTNVGAAKLANATALGAQVEITQMAVGDGNGVLPTPNPAQTALVHELRRKPLNSLSIDPNNANQIIAEQVIPEDEGGWWIREIGLFDKDGDMIAVANCAETYKPQLQEGSGRVQVVRMILIVSSTAAVTLKIDPSVVLATRQYVDDQIIQVKSYVDQKMAAHVAAADPHKQYAPKESPALTGRPTAPTAEGKDSSTQIANTAFVQAAIAALVGSSPEALDTLNELAAALGNDPNFATTVTNSLAGKMDKSANGSDIENVSVFLQNLGLGETINRAAGAMQKDQNGGDIPDAGLFAQNISAALAFSGGVAVGGDANTWTTVEFIAWLESCGAFNHPYWMCKGSWDYAGNKVITDTGCGNICLAGAVVEVMGTGGAITIRVTTPTTTSGGGVASAQFIYINHGDGYSPGWRRDFNTINKPTSEDVGALSVNGGRLNGPLGIGTDNALGGNSIAIGDNDTGFKQNGDGVLDVYANNARVGYIDNSGLHMSVDVLSNGAIRAGNAKKLSLTSNNNSALTATFNLWGDANRPTVIELDDDQGWHLYSQRNTDGSISFRVNGQMEPNSYSNFDSRYVQDIRLGSLQYAQVWNGPGFNDTSGYVITGITNGNSDELVDGAQRRPIQKLIGNQWYNVVSI
ncbi:phage tail protein [Salmonella enterica]|nr:phage tail protein [Salmonella enterica]ECS8632487.1 phage tail protein [Salmonella enterica subsp. enterica serovar Oslo]EAN4766585.1 phage tail protein [Salmonella enterica]EAS5666176.1 phage tail protein [Salmonella enterica]EAT0344304.1 phage tail protein [Salmonella enterica]